MNLNSDAVQNVAGKMINFESGIVKESTDGVGILSPDIAFSGIVGYMEVGTTVAQLDFLGYGNTANALVLADASDSTLPCCAIALEAGDSGDVVKVLLYGYLKAADLLFAVQAYTAFTMSSTYVFADDEYMTINGTKYQISVDGVPGDTAAVSIATDPVGVGIYVEATGFAALIAAINANDPLMTAAQASTHVMSVTATGIDIAATGNAVDTTTDITLGAFTSTVMAGGTNGGRIFLSDTAGDFGLSAGTVEQVLGQALSMREMLFNPGMISIA